MGKEKTQPLRLAALGALKTAYIRAVGLVLIGVVLDWRGAGIGADWRGAGLARCWIGVVLGVM